MLPTGKDEGYGWVVVGAVFTINVVVAGYIKSFGVLLLAIQDYFPDASNLAIGLVMSLLNGCRGLTAPMMGAMTVLIGARICVVIGALLTSIGLILAVFSTSIVHIAFSIGAIAGIGVCMSETPGVLIVNQYFRRLRSTANGLRTAGNPLGGMLFPLFYVHLLENFGLKGTYLMITGVMLQMCVMGFLLRPFETHKANVQKMYLREMKITTDENIHEQLLLQNSSKVQTLNQKPPIEFHFLKNPLFLFYISMNIGLVFVIPNSLVYSTLYAKAIGLSRWEISFVLSYYSGLDFICRLACGWLTDRNIYKKRYAFAAGLFISAIGLLLVPMCWDKWSLMGAISLTALGLAYYYVLIVVLLAEQFGEDSIASTYGFFQMSQGIGCFMSPPLLGLLADASGGLCQPFICMGSMMLVSMMLFILQSLIAKITGQHIVNI